MSEVDTNGKPPTVDWCHLPAGVVAESLWDPLHDGEILSLRSDLMARTVSMTIDVGYLRAFHGLADDARFSFELQDVESARVTSWAIWPGKCADIKGKSRDEQQLLIAEYQAKWREDSMGWTAFEAALAGQAFDISDAEVARARTKTCLKLYGHPLGGEFKDHYFGIILRAGRLVIGLGDDQVLDLEAFVKLGNDYWEAFAARTLARS